MFKTAKSNIVNSALTELLLQTWILETQIITGQGINRLPTGLESLVSGQHC